MNIFIVIPWRPTPSRIDVFNRLTDWYKKEFSDVPIVTADAGGEVFNLSASRNKGIKEAISRGADLIILSDADVFLRKHSLLKAIDNSSKNKVISAPYTRYHATKRDRFIENNMFEPWFTTEEPPLEREGEQRLWPCSGALVLPKDVYLEIGGFDEKYIGWGSEDLDYHKTYLNRYGRLYDYIDGDAYSIDHDKREFQTEELTKKNEEYFQKKFR